MYSPRGSERGLNDEFAVEGGCRVTVIDGDENGKQHMVSTSPVIRTGHFTRDRECLHICWLQKLWDSDTIMGVWDMTTINDKKKGPKQEDEISTLY